MKTPKYLRCKSLLELLRESSQEEMIQLYVDIIDTTDDADKKRKYVDLLKKQYNYDYKEKKGNAATPSLDNVLGADDFGSFDEYRKYAKKILRLRLGGKYIGTVEDIAKIDKSYSFEECTNIVAPIGIKTNLSNSIDSHGNYASAGSTTINLPSEVDVYTLIHEMGHIYDEKYYRAGPSKILTNSISFYGCGNAGECFAENFAAYFLSPSTLKSKLPAVYKDLNSAVNSTWKKVISDILKG